MVYSHFFGCVGFICVPFALYCYPPWLSWRLAGSLDRLPVWVFSVHLLACLYRVEDVTLGYHIRGGLWSVVVLIVVVVCLLVSSDLIFQRLYFSGVRICKEGENNKVKRKVIKEEIRQGVAITS